MHSRKKKNKYIFNNCVSMLILLFFVFLELLYFNVIKETNFSLLINSFPKNVYHYFNENFINYNKNNLNEMSDSIEEITNESDRILSFEIEKEETNINDDGSFHSYELFTSEDINEIKVQINKKDGSMNILENVYDDVSELNDTKKRKLESPLDEETTKRKKLKYEVVSLDYFNNTLFIGDSRMAGFEIYKRIPNAYYFCYSSASVFNIFENEDDVKPIGKIKLFDLLTKNKFDKIYIMLGINNLQTNLYNHKKQYKETLNLIKELQPEAIIYLIANLHITDIYDPTKPHLTNENVNILNEFIKGYADNVNIFYLDPNPMFDDENGNLKLEFSSDNVHIYVNHYDKFLVFLLSNALVEDTSIVYNIIGPSN